MMTYKGNGGSGLQVLEIFLRLRV